MALRCSEHPQVLCYEMGMRLPNWTPNKGVRIVIRQFGVLFLSTNSMAFRQIRIYGSYPPCSLPTTHKSGNFVHRKDIRKPDWDNYMPYLYKDLSLLES